MVIIITGATHTGKTKLAHCLMEKYKIPYLSIDHLKMGLIRSKNTTLTPYDDELLVPYLWNIVKEIIKTVIENKQDLIIEGCYVPFNFEQDFSIEYLEKIKYYCLIMSKDYIQHHFDEIKKYENIIEERCVEDLVKDNLIIENENYLRECQKHNYNYILINDDYQKAIEKIELKKDKPNYVRN